jgi:hypothetical protein
MSEQTMPRINPDNYREFRRQLRPFWLNRARLVLDALAGARLGEASLDAARARNWFARTDAVCEAIDSIYALGVTPGSEMWEALQSAIEVEMGGLRAAVVPLLQPYISLDIELEEGE